MTRAQACCLAALLLATISSAHASTGSAALPEDGMIAVLRQLRAEAPGAADVVVVTGAAAAVDSAREQDKVSRNR